MGGAVMRFLLPALLFLVATTASAEAELRTAHQELRIATQGGLPSFWVSCDLACSKPGAVRRLLAGPGEGALQWTGGEIAARLAQIPYRAEINETPQTITAVLTALEPVSGRILVQRYELSRQTRTLRLVLQAPGGVALRVSTGPDLLPPPLPGFGASFSGIEAVRIMAGGQEKLLESEASDAALDIGTDDWLGVRSRFWAWVAQPAVAGRVTVAAPTSEQRDIDWHTADGSIDLNFYAGPIEWKELRVVSPSLTQMLFAALWEPLRWLCYGLYFLLGWILSQVASPGIAIILLSLAVKIILSPLTWLADRWQKDVNRIQSRIQPRIAEIKSGHRGEEAHRLTLQVYRDEGVHPLFTLKSLAGFAIQVPMFIAAFDMLADNFALSGAHFLWIEDLAAPDRLMELPFALPFFGAHLNLLPFVMTAVTLLSAITLRDESLTPVLLKKQQRQLYLMAGFFLLLFYTFPAGMVLYWTANNVWHLLKVQIFR